MLEKIKNINFNENEINNLLKEMSNILDSMTNASNKEMIDLIKRFNKLRDHYLTLYWISYIGYLKDITNRKYLESEKLFGKYDSIYNNLVYRYFSNLIKYKDNKSIIDLVGLRSIEIAKNQRRLLSDNQDIQNLASKEKELCMNYRKLILGTKFEFENETINLSGLLKYMKSEDRSLRKKAYDKRYEILLSLNNELSTIMSELIKIRTEFSKKLGFNNYTEYGFIKMNRIGYNKDDLERFKANVIKYFVPISKKLYISQKERLKLDDFDYYDESILFIDGNAKIKYSLEEIIEKYKHGLKEINIELYNLFCDMYQKGLIDLENRDNKSNGGVTTFLPDFNYPTFIKKYMGQEENFTSITHEFGHCIQLYYSKGQRFHENRWPTFDICEIHSTSMELLIHPYIKEIFNKDTDKYCIRHLTSLINTIISMCAIDDFETKIYEMPNLTIKERNKLWKNILKKYYPYKKYNHEYFNLGISWQTDINRISDPFYGIDYSLATICALSIYEKEIINQKDAQKEFISLCKDGGSISLKELIKKHSLYNPFNIEDINKLSVFVSKEIDKHLKNYHHY